MSFSSGQRPILPKPPLVESHEGYSGANPNSALSSPSSKRKREVVSVACNNCRKQKTKCDSRRPTCTKCELAQLECEYAIPEGLTSQQAAQQKIESFERLNLGFQHLFELLRSEDDATSAEVLERIKKAKNIDDVVNEAAVAQSLLSIASYGANPGPSTTFSDERAGSRGSSLSLHRLITSPLDDPSYIFDTKYMHYARDQYVEIDAFVDQHSLPLDISRWTTASQDNRLMNHLLNMFWTWDNIVERMIYRPIFERDLVAIYPHSDDGQEHSFCSPFLVNALLALSCLYTLEPATFAIPQSPETRGRRFADEAENLLQKDIDKPSIALLQGLYAMFVYEGVLGKGSNAMGYFWRAMDIFNVLNNTELLPKQVSAKDKARLHLEREAISWVLWGLYVVEWKSSQAMGFRKRAGKPNIGKVWREENFSLSQTDSSGFFWFPYPMSIQTQRSMKVEVREAEVALAELVENALSILVTKDDARLSSADYPLAMESYNAFLEWRSSLSDRLRFEEAVLPSTILLHVAVEIMLISMLRPFCHLRKGEFGIFDPRERIYAHASSLMTAIWTFRAFAILRHDSWLVHAVSTAAFIVLRDLGRGPAQADTLIRACHCLHEMISTMPIANESLMAILAAFQRSEIPLPIFVNKFFRIKKYDKKIGLIHLTYAALIPTSYVNGHNIVRTAPDLSFQELIANMEQFSVD